MTHSNVDIFKKMVEGSYEEVSRIAYPLFKNTPLSYFCYQRLYDSGEVLYLGTGPDLAIKLILDNLLPTLGELNLFKTFGLRTTYLSHLMPLPPGAEETDPEKYKKVINCSAEEKLYHGLFIVDRKSDYYRICGFGVDGNLNSVYNFYLNIMSVLENFVNYFEYHADELIDYNCNKKLLIMPHYHNKLTLIDPEIKIPINFSELDFAITPRSVQSHFTQRERESLALIAQGYTMKNAAKKLGVSPRTIEQHLRNIKDKYGVNTKNQLVDLWYAYAEIGGRND